MKFFRLIDLQVRHFANLKTTHEMMHHGPLKEGQEVPSHTHQEIALYVVTKGAALFVNEGSHELGQSRACDAVVVPAQLVHGWKALSPHTVIEHVFGEKNVDLVLAMGAV